MNLTLGIGTDVATICFFHPEDLVGYAEAPMTWYATSYAAATEFERGRLIAFSTGSDGGFRVRITDEGLTERERTYGRASCEFRLVVGRGRVVIDNTDGLPSVEQMDDRTSGENGWFDVANGTYRATVTAVDWSSEPGSVGDDGRSTPDALTSYVMALEPVEDLESVGFPRAFPEIGVDATEPRYKLDFADEPRLLDADPPSDGPLPLIVTDHRLGAPGQLLAVPMGERPPKHLERTHVIVANDRNTGGFGIHGKHRFTRGSDDRWTYNLQVEGLIRISSVSDGEGGPRCAFTPVARPPEPIGEDLRRRLLNAFTGYALRGRVDAADFQIARMHAQVEDRALTNAIVGQLDVGPLSIGQLLAQNDPERAETLLQHLAR